MDWEGMVLWLSILSGVFILVFILYLKFINRADKNEVDYPQKLFLAFCRRLGKQYGFKRPYETASDYFSRIQSKNPQLSPSLIQIKEYYLKSRYGKGDVNIFKELIRNFKRP
jgi:hypothetical protein